MKPQGFLAFLSLMFCMCATPAWAAAPGLLGKHDSKEPIEITADSLDVIQENQKAVFTGNVVVIQGNVKIQSDKMTVFYKNSAEKKQSDEATMGSNAISKILTDGHVVLTTQDESAKGDNGIYDVEANMVYLTGHVILSKGKNVLSGNKLEYNLTTGQSRVTGGAGVKVGEKTSNGRVRGVFIPAGKGAQ